MNRRKLVLATVGAALALGVVALLGSLTAVRRADRIDELAAGLTVSEDRIDELQAQLSSATEERDLTAERADSVIAQVSANESRWLAAVATGGGYPAKINRLLAVEAFRRSPTPEALSAVGRIVLIDGDESVHRELQHDNAVWRISASPTGQLVATGSDDGIARIWTTDGDFVASLDHGEPVRSVAFSGDGERLVSGSTDGMARIWTSAGDLVNEIAHTDRVNDVAISNDGETVATASHDTTTLLVQASTGRIIREIEHAEIVWSVALSGDATRLATGSGDGLTRLWDVETGELLATVEQGAAVTLVDISPDGKWLVTGAQSGELQVLDATTGEVAFTPETGGRFGVLAVDWRPDGSEMAVVSLVEGVTRFELPSGALLGQHQPNGGTRGVAYGPEGDWFAVASGDFQFSFGELSYWDTSSGRRLVSLNLPGPVESIDIVRTTGLVAASYRTTEDQIEIGGAWLVPGRSQWIALACEGTDGIIPDRTWTEITGGAIEFQPSCP